HGVGAASATADVHSAIVREQEHRPARLLGDLQGVANVGRPTDLIEALLVRPHLTGLHLPIHPGGGIASGRWGFVNGREEREGQDGEKPTAGHRWTPSNRRAL